MNNRFSPECNPVHGYNSGTIKESLSGIVERITFHNLDNGWAVLRVSPFASSSHRTCGNIETVVVHQTKVFAGATMEFQGSWIIHPKYGRQFQADSAFEKKPASTAALEKYLGSGLIKGVGPKTAQKIVKYFDKNTLEVFETDIERLTEVEGIAHKKLVMISEAWKEHKSIRDVMMFLQSHGISTLFAVKIYKEYGDNAIKNVSIDPYRLANDFYGIGFFSADKIALSIGFEPDSDKRIMAAVRHILAAGRTFGHCYLTLLQIQEQTSELLNLDLTGRIPEILKKMEKDNLLKVRYIEEACYYSKSLYFDELYVAQRVSKMCRADNIISVDQEELKRWIYLYCKSRYIKLSDEQAEAVISIVSRHFSILTGGPGCGKTTTTVVIVNLLEHIYELIDWNDDINIQDKSKNKIKILLAAPTGRAAQRMSEVIGREAKTIHRLLEWKGSEFKKNEKNPLKADFLIVDECSMLDINLTASLLKAVPESCQVLFIGDPDQLPSVGAGNVLKDMIASGAVPCFVLTEIFRQAGESLIIKYAHQINKGEMPWVSSPFKKPQIWRDRTDCMFIDSDEATKEQVHFITQVKRAYKSKIEDIRENIDYPQSQPESINKEPANMNKKSENTNKKSENYGDNFKESYEFCINEPVKPYETEIKIPKKFEYVNINELYSADTEVKELMAVLKKIHPWSSLHYGYSALDAVRELYINWIPKYYPSCEIQILSPMTRGTLGTINLNRVIQASANPWLEGKKELKIGERTLRAGDRVIHRRNNYDLGVFNGDIGTIVDIDTVELGCTVSFYPDNRIVSYQRDDILELDLAYSITIHKSQGSEFDIVVIPILSQHFKMLFRNLIYTGLTRAKKLAVFVGTRKAMAMAVKNQDTTLRQTMLKELLE